MNITTLLQDGTASPLFLFALAMIVGGLHGLEPGHSKTMMVAYIVAIRGTVMQAFLLGMFAAISHSTIVWILAAIALTYGNELIAEELEPWFMMVSGLIIILLAVWMVKPVLIQFLQERNNPHRHEHRDAHARSHAKGIETQLANKKTGTLQTILFGLTGGLLPCPAAITVFIICMHLDKLTLGFVLVAAFSIGLAVTLVAVGCVAALGLGMIARKTGFLGFVTSYAPYFSSILVALIGTIFIVNGYILLI